MRRLYRNRNLDLNANNDNLANSKFPKRNETEAGRIARAAGTFKMKTYNNLYQQLVSYENLEEAFRKAKKGKSLLSYIIEFEKNLEQNLTLLKQELENFTYSPKPLKRFVIKDPKTRTIHS